MIEYVFTFENGPVHRFPVDVDRQFAPNQDPASHAEWTRLDYQQCQNCELKPDAYPHCPAAVDLEPILEQFQEMVSWETVEVTVHTPERTYQKQCDVQTGLRSLIGLVMASGGCPVLSQLKGLVHHHLPFATVAETLFHTTGTYLLRQYFKAKQGLSADMELVQLGELYKQLQIINTDFTKRIESASTKDANRNAISSLFFLSLAVSVSLEENLRMIQKQYER